MKVMFNKNFSNGMTLAKIEFWSNRYRFSFQIWGKGRNNVFIEKDNVELTSFGDEEGPVELFGEVIKWCERANPSIKYPESIVGKEIDLPD